MPIADRVIIALVMSVRIKEFRHRHPIDEALTFEEEFLLPCSCTLPRRVPTFIFEPCHEEATQSLKLAWRHLEGAVCLKVGINAGILHIEAQDTRMSRIFRTREKLQHLAVAHRARIRIARVVRHQFHRTMQDALVRHLDLNRCRKDVVYLVVRNLILFKVRLRLDGAETRAVPATTRPSPSGEAATLAPHRAIRFKMKHLTCFCIHKASEIIYMRKILLQLTRFLHTESRHAFPS